MDRPEFGIRLPVAGPLASADAIATTARHADELGYDAVWVHDFLVFTRYLDRTHISCGSAEAVERAGEEAPPLFFESITNLAYLAGITERTRIGVSVLSIPYRHPLITAKQLSTIDSLSKGRLIFGAGVGAPKTTHNIDFEVLGIPRTEKYARARDYLRAIVALWTGDGGYAGEFVNLPDMELYPRPVQKPHPPIWVSGKAERSLEILAELGSGWFSPWLLPDQYAPLLEEIHRRAAEAGRQDSSLTVATEVYVCIAETDEEARRLAQRTLDVLNVELMPSGMASPDTRLVGSPEHIAERIRLQFEAGVGHYEMKFIYRDVPHLHDQLSLFREAVMPNFSPVESRA